MLNLFSKFVVPGVDHVEIFQDDEDPLQFWMLPGKPELLIADDGLPAISLMAFAKDLYLMADTATALPAGEMEGGILNMSLELAVGQPDQATIVTFITDEVLTGRLPLPAPTLDPDGVVAFRSRQGGGTPRLSYPTWVDGTVRFTVLPAAGPTFVKGMEGSDRPSLTTTNLASYSVLLGQEGVRLLRESLKDGVFPGVIHYALTYQARIPNIHIRITGHARDVYNQIKENVTIEETKGGRLVNSYPQVSSLHELQSKVAGLHVEYDRTNFPAMPGQDQNTVDAAGKKLEDLVLTIANGFLMNKFCTPGFIAGVNKEALGTDPLANLKAPGAPIVGGNQVWLKDFEQSMDVDIDFSLDGRISQPINAYPNALLYEVVTPEVMAKRTSTADLNTPYFHVLDVPVRITANFEKDPIAVVKVTLDYHQTDDPTGEVKSARKTFTFTTGSEVFYFRTTMAKNADGSPKDTYTYSSELNYKAAAESVNTPEVATRDRSLVIGYAGLSCVQVECLAGGIPWDVVERVDVAFRYPGLDLPTAAHKVTLLPAQMAQSWFTYTGGNPSRSYTYELTYVLKDGQNLHIPAQTDVTDRLVIDAPFSDRDKVTFVAQGTFPPLQSIVLSVRYEDKANAYTVEDVHVFSAAAQTWEWVLQLRDATLATYSYKVDLTYADGSATHGDWTSDTEPTVLVGEAASKMLEIEVVPGVLDMTQWKLVLVRLHHTDPATGEVQDKTVQFKPGGAGDSVPWKVALRDPAARSFTYEVQGFAVDGSKKTVGPVTTEDPVLVVEL